LTILKNRSKLLEGDKSMLYCLVVCGPDTAGEYVLCAVRFETLKNALNNSAARIVFAAVDDTERCVEKSVLECLISKIRESGYSLGAKIHIGIPESEFTISTQRIEAGRSG
jgi:hypothetical protein